MGQVSIASGSTPDYYKREVKESLEAARERGYYSKAVASGEPPGVLLGRGLEALGLTVGSEVTDDISNRVFANLSHPTTGEALGRAQSNFAAGGDLVLRAAQRHGITVPAAVVADAKDALRDTDGTRLAEFTRARALDLVASAAPGVTPEELKSIAVEATRSTRRNVKYLDMTYTSGKDWSVAHAAADAAGDDFASAAYEEALTAATRAMADVAETLAYTRVGAHGKKVAGESTGKRMAADGLVVAAYRHHTNRDGEMHDHAHVLVLNRALDATGKYHALDGKQLYGAVPFLAAVASRAQELVGRDKLGLRYEKNPDGTRRIAAVEEGVCKDFSTRSASIEARLDEWARLWEETNGFAPTARHRDAQHKYIQRSTRRPKSDKHLVREDQVAQWQQTSLKARGASLSEVHQAVARDARRFSEEALAGDAIDQDAVVSEAIETLTQKRTSFNEHHLAAAIDQALPANLPRGMTIGGYQALLEGLVESACVRSGIERITPQSVIDVGVPAELRAPDGRSVYSAPRDAIYVGAEQLAREEYLSGLARAFAAPGIERDTAVALALDAGLYEDQAAAFSAVLSSRRSLEVLIGPAGTGKSYTVGHIASAWERAAKGAPVIGLALSEAAAKVLRAEGVQTSWNIDAWLAGIGRLSSGRARPSDNEMRLAPGALVIVDEAGMADTAKLAAVTKMVEAVGGKVLLTGDHRQIAAVEAGGVLAFLASDAELRREGAISDLTDVRRFSAKWEREASLRLRDGDASVLELYDRHGRVVEAESPAEAMTRVYDSWLIDTLEGKTSIMVAATAEEAASLAMRARAELVELGRVDHARTVELGNGALASAGDIVQARRNSHGIKDQRGRPLANRDRLVVDEVRSDGTLWVHREGEGRRLTLPPEYVAAHLELAYAVTAHGSQGRTVDSSYVLASEAMTAETLYVGLTRGKHMNQVVVSTAAETLDNHRHGPEVERSPALALLGEVMERSTAQRSALTMKQDLAEAAKSLAKIGPVWAEANGLLAQRDQVRYRQIADVLGPERLARLQEDPTAPAFWQTVKNTELSGIDPVDALKSTLEGREVDSGTELGALLSWRLTEQRHMAWEPKRLPGATDGLPPASYLERTAAPEALADASLVSDDLGAYARRLAVAMDERVAELGRRVGQDEPAWAVQHLGPVPAPGTSELEDWERRAGVVEAYREQYVAESKKANVADPIGRRPSVLKSPDRYVDWRLANRALGLDRNPMRDVSRMPDELLRRAVKAWHDEVEQGPQYVRHKLDQAARDAQRARSRVVRQLDMLRGRAPRRHLQAAIDEADQLQRRQEELQEQQIVRDEWFERMAETRTTAREAEAELLRRYPEGDEARTARKAPEELSDRERVAMERAAERQHQQQVRQQQQTNGLSIGGITP